VGKDDSVKTQVEALLVIAVLKLGKNSAIVRQVAFFVQTVNKRLRCDYRHRILLPRVLSLPRIEVYEHIKQRMNCNLRLKHKHLDSVLPLQSEMRIHHCRIVLLVVNRLSPIEQVINADI